MKKQIYLSRFIIETTSPFAIKSGNAGIILDSLVARDANDLPYIPATSLTGVLRSILPLDLDHWFGIQDKDNDKSKGSQVILSDAYLMDEDGKTVLTGLRGKISPYAKSFKSYVVRDRVKINDKGVATNQGKFDEELVPKGVRFAFMLEIQDDNGELEEKEWFDLLSLFNAPEFRIGGGSRNGRGVFKVIDCSIKKYDLSDKDALKGYLEQPFNPASPILKGEKFTFNSTSNTNWKKYSLKLTARDFFHFGAGFGDEEVDNTVKKEVVIRWDSNGSAIWQDLKNEAIWEFLIPATSIKGALAHRFAYHFNKADGHFSDKEGKGNENTGPDGEKEISEYFSNLGIDDNNLSMEELKVLQGKLASMQPSEFFDKNTAWKNFEADCEKAKGKGMTRSEAVEINNGVKELFGYEGNPYDKEDKAKRGNVLIHDIYFKKEAITEKLFNHVAIDRYTGGAKAGALFNEKAAAVKDNTGINLDVYVNKTTLEKNPKITSAWEATLNDLIEGRLPLGGKTNYGHGIFTGQITQ